jgi:hypothetical protein
MPRSAMRIKRHLKWHSANDRLSSRRALEVEISRSSSPPPAFCKSGAANRRKAAVDGILLH